MIKEFSEVEHVKNLLLYKEAECCKNCIMLNSEKYCSARRLIITEPDWHVCDDFL